VPVRGVIVACCLGCVLLFVVCGVVKLLSSLPSFPLNLKKKKKKIGFARGRNTGVVTYGIRAGSTRDLGSLQLSLI
jgi:hypothetical protein